MPPGPYADPSSTLDSDFEFIDRELTDGDHHAFSSEYIVNEQPMFSPRPLRIITLGAGASGLNMIHQLRKYDTENLLTHIVYEKNHDIGGTWLENRYPGCACDIPSHAYQFSWAPNPDWTSYYPGAVEIYEYFKRVAVEHDLLRYVQLNHKVVSAEWNEEERRWEVEVEDTLTGERASDWCDVFINGSGVLNNWKWPAIEGLKSFKGNMTHTATWDTKREAEFLDGKRVAVIGNGSSAVQLVPSIQPRVQTLSHFFRTPCWITAGYAPQHAGPDGANFQYSAEQKAKFRGNPAEYLKYRKEIEGELCQRFKFAIKDSPEQREAREFSEKEMKTKLKGDPRLAELLIPTFAVGCRRPTPGNGFLEAIVKENTTVINDPIVCVTERGIVTRTPEGGEEEHVFDTIICATGFDVSFSPRFPIIGQHKTDLRSIWGLKNAQGEDTGAKGYLSLAVPNFPNYFFFMGPASPVAHGSLLPCIEHVSHYLLKLIKRLQTENIRSLSPQQDATDDFNAHAQLFLKRTAWATHCRSWFKNGRKDGPISALWPGSRIHYFECLANVRWEDWEMGYAGDVVRDGKVVKRGNRFGVLGNGFVRREVEEGHDLTWYLNPGYDEVGTN
ncbi:hypothetical protein YB2330_002179 [Saitoella coloradoensis]